MTLKGEGWSALGEEGVRIEEVLAGIEGSGIMDNLRGWLNHLKQNIDFPVKAKVIKYEEHKWPLTTGDQVEIVGLEGVEDDIYDIIAEVIADKDKTEYFVPLCELETNEEKNKSINDYGVWFANL